MKAQNVELLLFFVKTVIENNVYQLSIIIFVTKITFEMFSNVKTFNYGEASIVLKFNIELHYSLIQR